MLRFSRPTVKIFLNILLGLVVAGTTLWVIGTVYYSPLLPPEWRGFASAAYAVATLLAFTFLPFGRTAIGALGLFAIVVILFFRIPASNDRDWQPEVAHVPYATIKGDLITIHNLRNFDYRTETDFTPRWETRTYDLRQLDSADVIAVYWAGKAIAHVMLSFGFKNR